MTHELDFDKENKIIILKLTGQTDKTNFANEFLKAFKLGMKIGYNRYLFNLTNSYNINTSESNTKFLYEEISSKIEIADDTKIAVVIDRANYSYDFLHTLALSLDFEVEMFSSVEKAMIYLTE